MAELELLALFDVERHKVTIAFLAQFRIHAGDTEIDIAARRIEILQQLAVKLNTVFDKRIACHKRPQKARLLGAQNTAQTAVRILLVADKRNAFDFSDATFENFENQVNAVVAAADDTGLDARGDTALLNIGLNDGVGIFFSLRRIENTTGLRFQDWLQIVVFDAVVALDGDKVDRRIFDHLDDQSAALRNKFNAFEKTRRLKTLERFVQFTGRDRLTTGDSGVGQDCASLDTLAAFDGYVVKDVCLRHRDIRQSRKTC